IQVPDPVLHAFRQAVEGLVLDDGFLESYTHGALSIPGLQELADQVREEVQQGSGVAWVKGPPAADFTEAEMKLFYLAIGEAMGDTMGNYGRLYDVQDYGGSYKTERIPVSQTRAATGFHTDSSARNTMPDVVALLCIQPARTGGESLIVSAATVHEELRKTNLGALTILYREFIRDIVTPGSGKTLDALHSNRFPVFSQDLYAPELSFRYMRYWIEQGHREANLSLGKAELAALDALDELLQLPQFAVRFKLEAGDQIWVNNHIVAHNRTEYEEDPQRPRHLVRMWIST
ncbi:MAG: TauD/TfdA family dioxygenase, partial [Pirellulales bacterium]